MKITIDGQQYHFNLYHQYGCVDTRFIKTNTEIRNKYLETVQHLKVLGHLSSGAAQPELIAWFEQQANEHNKSILIPLLFASSVNSRLCRVSIPKRQWFR
jgi:hypothetical protein